MINHKLVLQEHLNHDGYLFWGWLLPWVDKYGWITANLDFPGHRFVTIGLDQLFSKKAFASDRFLNLISAGKDWEKRLLSVM